MRFSPEGQSGGASCTCPPIGQLRPESKGLRTVAVSFEFNICTSNAAYVDMPEVEVVSALRKVAEMIESGAYTEGTVRDSNGNRVGTWKFDPEFQV